MIKCRNTRHSREWIDGNNSQNQTHYCTGHQTQEQHIASQSKQGAVTLQAATPHAHPSMPPSFPRCVGVSVNM